MTPKGLKVNEMEEYKTEEFYSFTNEDFLDLVSFLKKKEAIAKRDVPEGKGNRLLLLYGLVIDLLENGGRSRKLKTAFEGMYKDEGKVIEGFIKIVEGWLQENNGKGNLLEVIKVLRSNGHLNLAGLVEQFLLRYSLPFPENGGSDKVNVYSSSRDFLLVEENKDVSMGSVPLWNANPVEQALQNSVILEELFRKLNVSDQKVFRLVAPTWMNETFSYWRRSSLLQLRVPGNPDDKKVNGISMTSFVKLLDSEGSGRKRKGRNFELLEHPFHRYQLSYKAGRGGRPEVPFSCGQKEDKFWQICGPNIQDLEIDNAYFGKAVENTLEKICEKVFLDICPKLKKFKIGSQCRFDYPKGVDSQSENIKGKVAANLHTLTVEKDICEKTFRTILRLCPNLKTLVLQTYYWQTSNGLLPEESNGDCLKLEKLIIKYTGYMNTSDRFLSLRNYSETLLKKGFKCLNHLSLGGLFLAEARRHPFSVYAALANLSQTLKNLELEMKVDRNDNMTGDRLWFADLSPFAFPNLTALKLSFNFDINGFMKRVHFDFGTLKGMPKLEKLEFRVKNAESFARRPGTKDWVFNGNRNEYLPEGVTFETDFPEKDPILCQNLKQFTFIEWSLNEEDIKLFSAWFPNLTHLKAAVKLEFVPLLLENFIQLEKLDLETKRMVSLGNLRRFREMKKGFRICQTISGRFHQAVEMKEHNGQLYFANRSSE